MIFVFYFLFYFVFVIWNALRAHRRHSGQHLWLCQELWCVFEALQKHLSSLLHREYDRWLFLLETASSCREQEVRGITWRIQSIFQINTSDLISHQNIKKQLYYAGSLLMVDAQKHLRKITIWTQSALINKTGLKKEGQKLCGRQNQTALQ